MLSDGEIFDAFNEIAFLKDLKRTGWKRRKVPRPETVASHTHGLQILALLTCPRNLNRNKVILMLLIHDLVEAPKHGPGDKTPFCDIQPGDKKKLEAAMADYIFKKFSPSLGLKLRKLWQEFEDTKTPEAKFAKQLDKLEACLQARLYYQEKRLPWREVIAFVDHARPDIKDRRLSSLLEATAVRPPRFKKQMVK